MATSVIPSICTAEYARDAPHQAICKKDLIRGLHLPGGPEEKLSQYVDDTTAMVTDLYSIHKVVEVFQEYSRASGARLICKDLWLGRWTKHVVLSGLLLSKPLVCTTEAVTQQPKTGIKFLLSSQKH